MKRYILISSQEPVLARRFRLFKEKENPEPISTYNQSTVGVNVANSNTSPITDTNEGQYVAKLRTPNESFVAPSFAAKRSKQSSKQTKKLKTVNVSQIVKICCNFHGTNRNT
jgi:hypothetical protein